MDAGRCGFTRPRDTSYTFTDHRKCGRTTNGSTGVAVFLSAVITSVRASVQTGEARPNHGLTTVVTGHGLRYAVEISENSRNLAHVYPHVFEHGGYRLV